MDHSTMVKSCALMPLWVLVLIRTATRTPALLTGTEQRLKEQCGEKKKYLPRARKLTERSPHRFWMRDRRAVDARSHQAGFEIGQGESSIVAPIASPIGSTCMAQQMVDHVVSCHSQLLRSISGGRRMRQHALCRRSCTCTGLGRLAN